MTFNELQVRTFGVVEDWVTIARSGSSWRMPFSGNSGKYRQRSQCPLHTIKSSVSTATLLALHVSVAKLNQQ